MKKLIYTVLMAAGMYSSAHAQQDLTMSQQFFSRINKNPAGIGNVQDIDLFLLGKAQWLRTDYSPKSGVFNVQTHFKKINSGAGFSMNYEDIGVAKQMYAPKLVYDYCAKVNNRLLLTLGIAAGVQYSNFDPSQYTVDDQSEVGTSTFPDTRQTKVRPDFDFGMELVAPKFLIGASLTHLTENKTTTMVASRHCYVYGRYNIDLSQDFILAPALSLMHKNKTNVVELNATAFYQRHFWAGVTYHPDVMEKFSSNPVAITAGLEYSNFRFGYCFDFSLGKVSDYARSGHELLLSYSIKRKHQAAVEQDKFE
ncbi:MAG: PorP/SprF family type IX secretion system membrane protein [Paludibacteraceae bacterium]|nr:PorP/SprF family type IX secretion system membrane protein [Paludibacteraceae bacterium]MCQ2192396.1 PorP/SprF family type IX secretion system membrane protein [Paludibacteraceae bacterium]